MAILMTFGSILIGRPFLYVALALSAFIAIALAVSVLALSVGRKPLAAVGASTEFGQQSPSFIWRSALQALAKLPRANAPPCERDELQATIEIEGTWNSLGELVTVQLTTGKDFTEVRISSRSAYAGTTFDWGRNARNLTRFKDLIERELRSAGLDQPKREWIPWVPDSPHDGSSGRRHA
jgi:hypothetical protein